MGNPVYWDQIISCCDVKLLTYIQGSPLLSAKQWYGKRTERCWIWTMGNAWTKISWNIEAFNLLFKGVCFALHNHRRCWESRNPFPLPVHFKLFESHPFALSLLTLQLPSQLLESDFPIWEKERGCYSQYFQIPQRSECPIFNTADLVEIQLPV